MKATVVLAAALAASAQFPESPPVALALAGAEAFPNGRDILFVLDVEADNRTGRELKVRSIFSSPLDDLVLVVRDENGKELRRQAVSYHQSPFAPPGRLLPLAAGKTRHEVRVPVNLPADTRAVRVMLYGTLPESGVTGLLLTDVRAVAVGARR